MFVCSQSVKEDSGRHQSHIFTSVTNVQHVVRGKHRKEEAAAPTFFLECSDFLEIFFSFLCRWFKTCNDKDIISK